MNAIVYFPKTATAIRTLQMKVATVHAEAVIAKASTLPLPMERKNQLIDQIINNKTPPVDCP